MAKIDYEFDNEPLPPGARAPGGRRFRLIVIFIGDRGDHRRADLLADAQ